MIKEKLNTGLDYDDVLLVPIPSKVNSRNKVNLEKNLTSGNRHLKLEIPIIASPMKGIISPELIKELDKAGGIGIFHRFYYDDLDLLEDIRKVGDSKFGVSVGLNDNFYMGLLDYGPSIMCIDVANGYLDKVLDSCSQVKNYIENRKYNTFLMAGSVATHKGANALYLAGADIIRVGVGSGALCTTRNYTGVGVPQITAIWDVVQEREKTPWFTVADGGIRNSGDAVKALALGADLVMIGSLFAKTFESANNGIIYGMASKKLQEEYYHGVKSIEGLEKEMKKEISLKEFIDIFTYGIKSACTYMNAFNLEELRENAQFIAINNGSLKDGITN